MLLFVLGERGKLGGMNRLTDTTGEISRQQAGVLRVITNYITEETEISLSLSSCVCESAGMLTLTAS